MKCPECGGETMVVKTKTTPGAVDRQRKCAACGHQFLTQESRRPGVKVTPRSKKSAGAGHG